MAAGRGGGNVERIKRWLRTIYFLVRMVASLLALCAPLLVSFGDVMAHCVLLSSFVCLRCQSVKEHLAEYGFRTGLIDFPLVSLVRSLLIICVYSFSDGPKLSHGPYLKIASLCSFISILVLLIKACIFRAEPEAETLAPSSLTMHRLYLNKSWGLPALFLMSVAFALGHVLVAYRTSCRARRKLLFHRPDPESLLSYKHLLSGYQKVPRSPTPSAVKPPRCNSDIRRKVSCTSEDEEEFSVRLLADIDSLFMVYCGLTLHYKVSVPNSPSSSASSNSCSSKPNTCCRLPEGSIIHLEKTPKAQYQRYRSYNSQLLDSLRSPLLDHPVNFQMHFSKETPSMSICNGDGDSNSVFLDRDLKRKEKFGIILVHGFGGGVFSWRHIMVALACQVGCDVAAFDRPGWGLTSRPCRKDWEGKELPNPFKLESQVDMLLNFCSEMGFSSVVLVGHDDGGLLALKAAQRIQAASTKGFNVEIRAVVLLSLSLSRDVVPPFARILLRTSLGKKHLVRPLLRTEITQVVNRRAWYNVTKLTTDVLNLYKEPLCIKGWDEALNEIAKVSSETILSSEKKASLLAEVADLPTLVIAGAEDALVSFKSIQAMASNLVNSTLIAVSGCGHLPHEECPEAVLAALSPFITRFMPSSDHQRSS